MKKGLLVCAIMMLIAAAAIIIYGVTHPEISVDLSSKQARVAIGFYVAILVAFFALAFGKCITKMNIILFTVELVAVYLLVQSILDADNLNGYLAGALGLNLVCMIANVIINGKKKNEK